VHSGWTRRRRRVPQPERHLFGFPAEAEDGGKTGTVLFKKKIGIAKPFRLNYDTGHG